ncbi:MAG: CDP-alcohol phosphatidyltransferase family protein [Bacteroidota bacterium]
MKVLKSWLMFLRMSQIESTLKPRDVEETLDIYFYRPLGYFVARAGKTLRLSPNAVTIISIFIGVAAGHLFYYRDIVINLWGIVLWVIADILDSADGQLARMTNTKSRFGRVLDGFATNIIFLSMYTHLFLRMLGMGYSPWWGVLVLAGGVSHSLQSSMADYYRNAYLKFVIDPEKSELHRASDLRADYEAAGSHAHPFKKFLGWVYLDYTERQEKLTKNFQKLRNRVESNYHNQLPDWFREEYRRYNRPLLKYYAILTTNTRMIAMSICVLIGQPLAYFFVEAGAINIVMIVLSIYQERVSWKLTREVEAHGAVA